MKFSKLIKGFAISSLLALSSLSATSCSILDNGGEKGDQHDSEFVDYVHTDTKIRLKLDYKGKNFYKDGIAQVDLYTGIDGDTSHFKQVDFPKEDLVKSRYYGIDTPESTGQVEPYGKKASKFTTTKLEEAKTIVVTSTVLDKYVVPETDSTGGRYLSLVWISDKENCPYNELVLLNLWVVQEGLSLVKNLDKFPEFKDTFMAANEQARNKKLNLFSGEPDDEFNYGDYEDTSLLDIKKEIIASLHDSEHKNKFDNKKVRVQGTVVGYANRILFLQAAYEDEDTGEIEYAGLNVFCGMNSIPGKYCAINTYIELCGLAQDSENFGFQITSVHGFPKIPSQDPNDTKVIYSPDKIPDELKAKEFKSTAMALGSANNYASDTYLFATVNVEEEVYCSGGYDSASTPANVTLYTSVSGTRTPFTIYIPFLYQPDPNDEIKKYTSFEEYKGHTFKVKGIYSFHLSTSGNLSYQLVLRSSEDLVEVS